MTPSAIFHGIPQNPGPKPPPYHFELVDQTGHSVITYRINELYKVRISGIDCSFRGFLLQARPASSEGYPIGHLRAGTFVYDSTWASQGVKVQPCPGVFNDSLTHATNDDRSQVEVTWKPTLNYGPILFVATIVQNRTLFWSQWLPSGGLLFPDAEELAESTARTTESPPEEEQEEEEGEDEEEAVEPAGNASQEQEPGVATGATKITNATGTTVITVSPISTTILEETTPAVVSSNHSKRILLPPAPSISSIFGGGRKTKGDVHVSGGGGNGTEASSLFGGETGLEKSNGADSDDDELVLATFNPPIGGSSSSRQNGTKDKELRGPPAAPMISEEEIDYESSSSNDTETGKSASRPPPSPSIPHPPGQTPPPVDVTDYCAEKPCANNGSCLNVPDEERYQCVCTKDWAGLQCSEPNLCANHQCKNGAHCVNGENSYTCKCLNGWGGDLCDKSCPPYLCQNGGTCKVSGGNESETYDCLCPPGWTGKRCQKEIKHCESNPCQNGGICVNRFNAFECKCKNGYMGQTCHRPCQDIYHSCEFWGEQEKCESQRENTKWFDINCAVTCGQCKYDNDTINADVSLPPVLEPFKFILGRWTLNSTSKSRFPVDFRHNNSTGYYEEIVFSVAKVPQFGPPSINFTSTATNNRDEEDIMISVGFLTVRPSTTPLKTFFMTTGNDGTTVLEAGTTNDTQIALSAQYFGILPSVDDKAPATSKRTFSIANHYLKMDVERTTNKGEKDYFTNYYWRDEELTIF